MARRIQKYRVVGIGEYLPGCDGSVCLRSWTAREASDIQNKTDQLAAQIATTVCDSAGDLLYTYSELVERDPMSWDAMTVNMLVGAINTHCLGEGVAAKIEDAEKN